MKDRRGMKGERVEKLSVRSRWNKERAGMLIQAGNFKHQLPNWRSRESKQRRTDASGGRLNFESQNGNRSAKKKPNSLSTFNKDNTP